MIKVLIRSEVVVEREIEMTEEEFNRCYGGDYGEAAKWLRRSAEAKLHDRLCKLANVSLGVETKVFIREGQNEHSENQSV